MPKRKNTTKPSKKPIEQYEHKDKDRANNPPVGLVTSDSDKESPKKKYQYDPHLDPQLIWAGKAERLSFDVDTVSLHVHERIDPRSIIEAVRKKNGSNYEQMSLFNDPEEKLSIREAIQFYKHRHNWSNRLIAGDSLLVMNSLIEKEGLAGQVQMIYIDPPYGIKYGSNFQPFINKRDVKDGKDEDLNQEPEMIKAFRDTWELGIHSYLTYLRDRLLLAKELLNDTGSVFVQISDENVHHVRELMDEVFENENFISIISFRTTGGLGSKFLSTNGDYLIWYAKDKKQLKFRQLFIQKEFGKSSMYRFIETKGGKRRMMSDEELLGKITDGDKPYRLSDLVSSGLTPSCVFPVVLNGRTFEPGRNRSWKTNEPGMKELIIKNRLEAPGKTLQYVNYFFDFPVSSLTNFWTDTVGELQKEFVVQTSTKIIERCMLMCSDPGDLVFDPTCGSGTTASVAEQWGRRWVTCDTSRVALTLAKQRLMTSLFDYYELAHPSEGVGSGFNYKTVPHITLKSIANNEPPATETLYDQPLIDRSKARVTGPFTVEAVPSPGIQSIDSVETHSNASPDGNTSPDLDASIARSGETLRQSEWREELLKTGIRGKNNQYIKFTRVEPLAGTRWLHVDAETQTPLTPPFDKGGTQGGSRVVISFGPEHAPLEQRQVELALEEAHSLVPKPKIIAFASFQFDPEAAKDIEEINYPGVTVLKVQMNTDLLTDDLKKKRSNNESFWLIGSPDVRLKSKKEKIPSPNSKKGKNNYSAEKTLYQVEVLGFDYFNTKTGEIDSGGKERIAMWMLDTDYDGRSLFPRQVFFPMSGPKDGWARLAKNLKAEIDEELIEQYKGTVSLPFEAGEHKRIAVKIVDDRGIESLKVMGL